MLNYHQLQQRQRKRTFIGRIKSMFESIDNGIDKLSFKSIIIAFVTVLALNAFIFIQYPRIEQQLDNDRKLQMYAAAQLPMRIVVSDPFTDQLKYASYNRERGLWNDGRIDYIFIDAVPKVFNIEDTRHRAQQSANQSAPQPQPPQQAPHLQQQLMQQQLMLQQQAQFHWQAAPFPAASFQAAPLGYPPPQSAQVPSHGQQRPSPQLSQRPQRKQAPPPPAAPFTSEEAQSFILHRWTNMRHDQETSSIKFFNPTHQYMTQRTKDAWNALEQYQRKVFHDGIRHDKKPSEAEFDAARQQAPQPQQP